MVGAEISMKSRAGVTTAIFGLFAGVVLARLVVAALVPIVQDEAYYINWSKALDWGYFDHPPLIAWVNVTSWLWPGSAFLGRLGAMLAAALAFPFLVGLFRRAGPDAAAWAAGGAAVCEPQRLRVYGRPADDAGRGATDDLVYRAARGSGRPGAGSAPLGDGGTGGGDRAAWASTRWW